MLRTLTLATLCLLVAVPAHPDDLIALKQKVLANGVMVLVWERPSAGRVGTRMFYRVDVAAERPGTTGLTHMLEHFLFKGSDLAGTTNWEAEKAIAEQIERLERQITDEKNRHRDCFRQRDVFADVERDCQTPRLATLQKELDTTIAAQDRLSDPTWYDWAVQGAGGTNSTASTGSDWMKFDIDLPASKLELFMWTERARVERPVFRQFEAEREVVVNQIRGGDNRPDSKFERALQSMTYEASPYGWSHWFSDLTRATREDHWEIFHKYFIPQNAIIVVVGEVKADDVFAMAEAYWGSWQPGRPSPRLRTVEPPPVGQKRLTVSAAAGPRLAINVPMPAAGHPDAPVFQVLGEVLSGEDGLLAKELVTRRQIATSARASGSPSKYPSHFSLRVDVRGNEDLDDVEQGIGAVLDQVLAGSITKEEISAAAGRLTLNLARGLEEIGDAAVTIGAMESIHHAGYLNALPSLWSAVTAADLTRIARTYFGRDLQTVGVLRRESAGSPSTTATGAPARTPQPTTPAAPSSAAAKAPVAPPLNGDRAADAATVRNVSHPPVERLPDPLAIAENPWNAPPWMAARRPSRFVQPAPTLRHTQLKFTDVGFTPPSPAKHLHTLSNGIRSFIVAEPLLPMVQFTVMIDAPALADPAGKEGRASLLANILRRTGTTTKPRREIEEALDRLNAVLTISADQNGTRAHVLSPPESASQALALVAGLVLTPDLASVFEAERERLAIAASRAADSPVAQARHLFDTTLYGADHPIARRPTAASVRAITLEDVRQLHESRYRAGGIALAISGRVDRPAIERAVSDAFGKAAAGTTSGAPTAANAAAAPKVTGRVTATKDIDIRQGHVLIGHAGIQGIPEDHAALEVMNYILSGGGFVSRMMKLLRTDTGITSALSGSVEPGRGVVNPYLWRFSGRPETIAQGVRLSLEQIALMREKGVTEEEFQAARTAYLDGLVPASYETAHETAVRLATQALFGLYDYQAPQYLNYYAGDETQLAALRKLTREDVNRAARKYLDPANLVVVVAGPLSVIRENATAEERALLGDKR